MINKWKKLVDSAEFTCDGYYGPGDVIDAARAFAVAVVKDALGAVRRR